MLRSHSVQLSDAVTPRSHPGQSFSAMFEAVILLQSLFDAGNRVVLGLDACGGRWDQTASVTRRTP